MSDSHGNQINGHTETNGKISLPSAKPYDVTENVVAQAPLTRRGHGPALVLLVPEGSNLNSSPNTLDPPPLQKWAEEGWAVAQITIEKGENASIPRHVEDALKALSQMKECDTIDRVGVISFNVPESEELTKAMSSTNQIKAVVTYGSNNLPTSKHLLRHYPGEESKAPHVEGEMVKTFGYPGVGDNFVIPAHKDFRSADAHLSHTRCLAFLKIHTLGPYFNLEAIWDEHTKFEFGERNVEETMATMVQEPYVNHIPTITGGIGREHLTWFYTNHFVFANPEDTKLNLVSRTVGLDRVIDEFNFSFTHDKMIDWLVPGIPPTGKYVEIPFTAIINVRGDRLYHEHINWDQATVLRQLGLMPEYLPWPYETVDGKKPAPGKRFEYRVPTAGIETSKKLVDERSVESNKMFDFAIREVDI